MGNTACCAVKDSEMDKKTTSGNAELLQAEAVPVLEDSVGASLAPPSATAAVPQAEKGEEGTYSVTLDKAGGQKLGLDVDYMAERRVLPIMSITGGLAEQWNSANATSQLRKGDSITEVNGIRGNVASMLEKCKNEKVLHLSLIRSLTADSLKADLEELVKSMGCGPILVRLSWHDAGVFAEGRAGCPNAALRWTDGGESKFKENAGLPTVALSLLRPISDKFCPDLISHADLWTLAANVAIKTMGGPDIATRFGRTDAKSSAESVASADGRLPDAVKGAEHLRTIFQAKGFDDKAIVALSGAHTIGSCHADRSGFDGAWTEQPLVFDNTYFKELLSKTYTSEATAKGCQHRHGATRTIMLNTDMALLEDPGFRPHVEHFAKDQAAFFQDFTSAWTKLQESGCEGLRDIL